MAFPSLLIPLSSSASPFPPHTVCLSGNLALLTHPSGSAERADTIDLFGMMRSSSHSESESGLLKPQMKQGRRGLRLEEVHRVPAVSARHRLFQRDKETKQTERVSDGR